MASSLCERVEHGACSKHWYISLPLTQLLVEISQAMHFDRHFTHLHRGDPARDREALRTALLAEATNLGLTKMADATSAMPYDRLTWVSDWYIRDECYTKALAEMVNFALHHACVIWEIASSTALRSPRPMLISTYSWEGPSTWC